MQLALIVAPGAAFQFASHRIPPQSSFQMWWHSLARHTAHFEKEERALVFDALERAHSVHEGQMRRDGQPFITHPVAVGELVASWGMDHHCVAAALLHDAVEDTALTFSELEHDFGGDVRSLVQGVTRISKLDPSKRADSSSLFPDAAQDDWLCLLDSCGADWRVAVLKIADRLHNMRTLGAMAPHKRARKARQTSRIFVPLAHYLGADDAGKELALLSALHRDDDQLVHAHSPALLSVRNVLVSMRHFVERLLLRSPRLVDRERNFRNLVFDLSQAEPHRAHERAQHLYASLLPLEGRFSLQATHARAQPAASGFS